MLTFGYTEHHEAPLHIKRQTEVAFDDRQHTP
jgi:hypothetical protein